jgi:hypothetical protein
VRSIRSFCVFQVYFLSVVPMPAQFSAFADLFCPLATREV